MSFFPALLSRILSSSPRLGLGLTLLCLGTAFAGEPLPVGTVIPDTTVFDAMSAPVALRTAVAAKPTLLVFYRGGWCPFCVRHLAALGESEAQIAAAGFQILAISADQPSKLAETPGREKLGYTLLSDASMSAAQAFGITFQVPEETVAKMKSNYRVDIEAASGQTHHLLPHPAVFIVDTAGVIRFAHVNPDYKQRLTTEALLTALATVKP